MCDVFQSGRFVCVCLKTRAIDKGSDSARFDERSAVQTLQRFLGRTNLLKANTLCVLSKQGERFNGPQTAHQSLLVTNPRVEIKVLFGTLQIQAELYRIRSKCKDLSSTPKSKPA